MEILEATRNRRSIRKYRHDPVDDRTLETVLEAARWAPSWKNNQCWRFVVVQDSAIKNQLADTLTSLAPTNITIEAIKEAPVLIVACAEVGKSGYSSRQPDRPRTDKGEWWYMYDVALAMQNLILTAHSLGLGTVHVGEFDAKEAAHILDVPDGYCIVSMTPLGYPDEQPDARPRKELSEIVFYDKYGMNTPS
jgi:nitroreductase